MIGVFCQEDERKTAQEFFELFKTPWEFINSSNTYDVIISTCQETLVGNAKLMLFYSSGPMQVDVIKSIKVDISICNHVVDSNNTLLPIYGSLSNLTCDQSPLLYTAPDSQVAAVELIEFQRKIIRIGFDLFNEITFLLTAGQPIKNAFTPTIEFHISMLRNWIVSAGIPLVEIPPIPFGYKFFACLTHDVDFAGVRTHKFDYTMWGFVYRAIVGSVVAFLRGRVHIAKLIVNWMAVVKLPFVFAGVADDFWEHFDKYAEIEAGLSSTFFLIPYKNQPGVGINIRKMYKRATHYDIGDVRKQVKKLMNLGFEIGVHGINAWTSSEQGSQEMMRITEVTGQKEVGVRMHWLYYNDLTPRELEQAGFEYDATLGYNETVGFKNGTLQVFQPIGVRKLLEIPLNIQDTALFYPRRLNLNDADASQLCKNLIDAAYSYGGVLTVSWHERSLVPERLWGDFYKMLIEELRTRGAWIGNARQVVAWFRRRRSVNFEGFCLRDEKLTLKIFGENPESGPQMFLRFNIPSYSTPTLISEYSFQQIDIEWNGEQEIEISVKSKEGK